MTQLKSTPAPLSAAAERRLSAYARAALAGAGALSAAQVGHAAVLSFGYNNVVLKPTTVGTTASFSLFTGGPTLSETFKQNRSNNFFLATVAASHNTMVVGNGTVPPAGNGQYGTNLAPGAAISAGRAFATANSNYNYAGRRIGYTLASRSGGGYQRLRGNFVGQTGYLGFKFTDPNNAAQTDFGWVHIGENANQSALTIISAAYDNTGARILAAQGEVPEPTSVGLLAGGACAVGLWRRRAAQRRAARAALPA